MKTINTEEELELETARVELEWIAKNPGRNCVALFGTKIKDGERYATWIIVPLSDNELLPYQQKYRRLVCQSI